MAVTIAELGARVLRRLGVAVVAASDRPALTATVPLADIATQALQTLGIVIPAGERPALSTTVPAATIATRALEWLGVVSYDVAAEPANDAMAQAKVSAIHDSLVAQGIVPWDLAHVPQA